MSMHESGCSHKSAVESNHPLGIPNLAAAFLKFKVMATPNVSLEGDDKSSSDEGVDLSHVCTCDSDWHWR